MRTGYLANSGQKLPLAAFACEGFLERARGLLFRPPLTREAALLIEPCRSVHMLGMRYAIDVAFVDRAGLVLKIVPSLRPARFAAAKAAHAAWEFAAGGCAHYGIQLGATLEFEEAP
jgi:uncharacterized membrane protein (UPF0127 family)